MAGVRTVENVDDFEKLLGDAGGYENNFTLLRSFLFFGFPQILVTICVLTLIFFPFCLHYVSMLVVVHGLRFTFISVGL